MMSKRFKKIAYHIHLWLGGLSGIVMFVVCITGAIWAVGINNWLGTADDSIVVEAPYGQPLLAPSVLIERLQEPLQGHKPSSISYKKDEPSTLRVYADGVNLWMSVNPYTADVISLKDYNARTDHSLSFWDYMRWGHRALWLPWDVGRVIVNYGTLMFLLVLVSGLILWFPKSWKGAKNRLLLNWKKETKWKRKFYDLHLVLGFYASFFLIVICCTGMVWGLQWWSAATYKLTTGNDLPDWGSVESTASTSLPHEGTMEEKLDLLFADALLKYPTAQTLTLTLPEPSNFKATIGLTVSYNEKVLYDYDSFYYDAQSLQEISAEGYRHGKYSDKSFGEKLRRQNYDLHIGAVWGEVGRVLMFFAALFGASLPLTGYYILFVVKRKKRKK